MSGNEPNSSDEEGKQKLDKWAENFCKVNNAVSKNVQERKKAEIQRLAKKERKEKEKLAKKQMQKERDLKKK
jgi:hypothetical protein